MRAELIDGTKLRNKILQQLEIDLIRQKKRTSGVPGLAVIRVGYDPASSAYIRQKKLVAQGLGYDYREHLFAETAEESEVIERLRELNKDASVHGILLQLPLPAHLNCDALIAAIEPNKDVDGMHPLNAGLLSQGRKARRPCTPWGVMRLLKEIDFDPAGKHAVIVGRSNIVGKPMAMLLLAANATVTVCHRHSDVAGAVQHADLVVAATGQARSIKGSWIKPGAVVIDAGINQIDGKLVGDVEFEEACERASHITPVPGGVGAVTVAMLMCNTFLAWAEESERTKSVDIHESRADFSVALRQQHPAHHFSGSGWFL
jgi:methylenetetrahydrofolate dehydrogenase (NADP+)/methenyltetrahydrofolate cyclohydrolase